MFQSGADTESKWRVTVSQYTSYSLHLSYCLYKENCCPSSTLCFYCSSLHFQECPSSTLIEQCDFALFDMWVANNHRVATGGHTVFSQKVTRLY